MRLSDLIEQLNEGITPDKAVEVFWQKRPNKYIGTFTVNEVPFVIEIFLESKEDLEKRFGIKITAIDNPIIYHIDFSQVGQEGYISNNTNNMGIAAMTVLSTVAYGTAKFFLEQKLQFNVVYFAAKSYADQKRNQRESLYPKIASYLAPLSNSRYEKIKYTGGTITAITRGFPFDPELHDSIRKIKPE